MHKLSAFLLSSSIFPWLVLTSVHGGTISIETQVQTTVHQDTLDVKVHLTNRGNEAAQSVYVKTVSSIATLSSSGTNRLDPGSTYTTHLRHALKGLRPGRYPFIVYTHYSDLNGYPFSALTVALIDYKITPSGDVMGAIETFKLKKSAQADLRLKNLGLDSKNLHIRFIVPNELSAKPQSLAMVLPPQGESHAAFAVHNFSALSGSRYHMYAVIEYDQNETHHSILVPTLIQIVEGSLFSLMRDKWRWITAGVLLILGLLLGRVYWEKRT